MLETADLILRPGRPEDGPALHANLWQHASVFQYLFSRPSPDDTAGIQRTAAYAGMHQEVPTEFFVCEKATGQPITLAHYLLRNPTPNKESAHDPSAEN